jgi:hypothetical protein
MAALRADVLLMQPPPHGQYLALQLYYTNSIDLVKIEEIKTHPAQAWLPISWQSQASESG